MSLLPRVDPDIGHSIAHYLDRYKDAPSDIKVIKKELCILERENPAIAEFIQRWSAKEKSKKKFVHAALCGILVYRLLHSQAESDLMEAEFKLI